MPIRTRLRRAFTRGSQDGGSGGSLSKITSKSSKPKPDSNVYQPGEKMPPMKYRRPVAPEHKAHLESFTWAKAWRRKSEQSLYSPMGSRMPSRKNSIASFRRRSFGGRSRRSLGDRKSSYRVDDEGLDSGVGASIAGDDRPELLREGSDEEGDITNVGLSRHPTQDPRRKSSSIRGRSQSLVSGTSRPVTADATGRSPPPKDTPFSPEDLELALKRSHLEAPQEESDRSGEASPGSPGPGLRPREGPAMLQVPTL